ncbi:MAG: sigma-70 family RNA polymerase sigma factor [Lentisphaerales bacterium]|nr:MAG: sigma-70 family RNA polymerase sigma factor [Lentisphaerales bacterium]
MISEPDTLYDRYLKDVSRYERVTPKREAELSRQVIHGRNPRLVEKAVNELVQANLLLVIHCRKEFVKFLDAPGARLTQMDLIAEGNIGLINAARNFDAGCGKSGRGRPKVRFSTYACKRIKNAMRRALKLSRFIHVPEHHFSYWTKIREIENRYGEGITDDILQGELGVGSAKLDMLKQSAETGTILIEDTTGKREGGWHEITPDEHALTPSKAAEQQDMKDFLVAEMLVLPERTRKMLALIYFDESATTYSDLAKIFGVSKERCRQVCTHGLSLLRQRIESRMTKVTGQRPYTQRPSTRDACPGIDRRIAQRNLVAMPKSLYSSEQETGETRVNAA